LKIQNVALGAFALSISLISAAARAQEDGAAEAPGQDIPEPPASDEADPDEKPEAAPAKAEAGGEAGIKLDANAATASAGADAEASGGGGIESEPDTPRRKPVYGQEGDWFITPYGYARFDAIFDSTQSFEDGYHPFLIARAGTYKGDHRRATFTARDSRVGFFIGAPTFEGMRSYAQIELDFFGLVPTDARKHDIAVFGPVRIRHAFYKLETPAPNEARS
jgi:hypothetical protein